MILVPFSFLGGTGGGGGPIPVNNFAPSISVVNDVQVTYLAGSWTGATLVTIQWYLGGVLQEGETGTTFVGQYDQDITAVETAVNEFGSAQATSNIINVPQPQLVDSSQASWDFAAELMDDIDNIEVSAAGITWEVFGSVV